MPKGHLYHIFLFKNKNNCHNSKKKHKKITEVKQKKKEDVKV